MWAEAEAWFLAHRRTLAAAGRVLHATLEPAEGLLCTYSDGKVRLALPDRDTSAGRLQRLLLSALAGVTPGQLDWLYRALLPRLVAHEIGHALRAEHGRLGPDVLEEEQVADRIGDLMSRPHLSRADLSRARVLLGEMVGRLGGLPVAAGLHRHAAHARARLGVHAPPEELQRAAAHLQTHYHRDLNAYLRLTAAWAFIDLTLCQEDSLDSFCADHLTLVA